MQPALHLTAKVLPGQRIEFQLPDSVEGQQVEIFIVMPAISPTSEEHKKAMPVEMANDPQIQAENAAIAKEFDIAIPEPIDKEQYAKNTDAILARIRSRPKINPQGSGMPDSTMLIREDRDR
jgi:hypothetical protein